MIGTNPPHPFNDTPSRLLRCLLRLNRRLRVTRTESQLSSVPLQVLGILYRTRQATATALATELGIKKQSLTLLLTMLHEKGYVARERNTADARKISLSLTPAGQEAFLQELHGRREILAGLMQDNLSEADVMVLASALPILEKLVLDDGASLEPEE